MDAPRDELEELLRHSLEGIRGRVHRYQFVDLAGTCALAVRSLVGTELEQYQPLGLNVSFAVLALLEEFGSHVLGGTHAALECSLVVAYVGGEAQIAYLEVTAVTGDLDVVGLDVSVHDVALVQLEEALGQLHGPLAEGRRPQLLLLGEILLEVAARHKLRDEDHFVLDFVVPGVQQADQILVVHRLEHV